MIQPNKHISDSDPDLQERGWFGLAQLLAYINVITYSAPDIHRMVFGLFTGSHDFHDIHPKESSLILLLVALAPLVWLIRLKKVAYEKPVSDDLKRNRVHLLIENPKKPSIRSEWMAAIAVGVLSLVASVATSQIVIQGNSPAKLYSLPLGIHDEFSYLFQAQTYLAGRLSFSSHPEFPDLFDQMHIVNEGRYASRYFPGTGLWIAPFATWGHPILGQWVAACLSTMLIFGAGRELGGFAVGLLAGIFTAISPALSIFHNLLLSHSPCLLGLALFLYAFLRMIRTNKSSDALLSGIGLTIAMLCRPLTTASFALPFGIYFMTKLCWKLKVDNPNLSWSLIVGYVVPLACSFLFWGCHNYQITGSIWKTPYQLYNEVYTPRHCYGLNNGKRGEARSGPKVIDKYDQWATNLTPPRAAINVERRLIKSFDWSLSGVPLTLSVFFMVIAGVFWNPKWLLLIFSISCIHFVHAFYWFDGILGFHYVLETVPLLMLVCAGASVIAIRCWVAERRILMPIWWSTVLLLAVLQNGIGFQTVWGETRLMPAVQDLCGLRARHAEFNRQIDEEVLKRPAIVLIQPNPSDIHMEHVVNHPDLDRSPIIYGKIKSDDFEIRKVLRWFPTRTCYIYDAISNTLKEIHSSEEFP